MIESFYNDMTNNTDTISFRFDTRKKYEEEMIKLLSIIDNSDLSKFKLKKLEDSYEELVEEYMQFCSTEINGK